MRNECRGSSWSLYIRCGASLFVLAILSHKIGPQIPDRPRATLTGVGQYLLSALKVVNLVPSHQKAFNARHQMGKDNAV
jgi:hypothetical protein